MSRPPLAEVTSIRGTRVTVRCPLCSALHEHKIRTTELGQTERRAPGCGVGYPLTPEARATGYTFRTPTPEGDCP